MMVVWSTLAGALILGFAYIIWILSVKEAKGLKLTGQIIAAVIAVLVIVLLIYGAVAGSKMKNCGAGGMGMMMQGKEGRMMEKMMEKMKEGSGRPGMMKERMRHER